jgi:FkbM family methyltransferase
MLNRLINFGLRLRWLRIAVERLQFRKLVDVWLRHFPLVRSLPETGITYRMRSLNSLGVAHDIFYQGAYDSIRPLLRDVRTIADIGSNSGFFTCFLANAAGNSAIRGLLVDANPEMVREAKWHMDKNGLSQMRAVQGLVGANPDAANEVFYVHSDAACSSCYPSSPDGIVTLTGWRPIQVPVLSLGNEWSKYFGDTPCDLLKVDIEGSEADFIQREADFVTSVRFLLLEIHHWLVDASLIENQLATLGFKLRNSLPSLHNTDVRLYINGQSKPASAQVSSAAQLAHTSY